MKIAWERKAPQLKYFLTWVAVKYPLFSTLSAMLPASKSIIPSVRYGIAAMNPLLARSKSKLSGSNQVVDCNFDFNQTLTFQKHWQLR